MDVGYRLAGRRAVIDSHVEAVWVQLCVEISFRVVKQGEQCNALIGFQQEEGPDMPARNYQRVSR